MKPFLYLGDINGPEGNAYAILGAAFTVAKENDMDWDSIEADAKSKDYDHLIDVMKEHFDVQVLSHVETKPL